MNSDSKKKIEELMDSLSEDQQQRFQISLDKALSDCEGDEYEDGIVDEVCSNFINVELPKCWEDLGG